MNIALWVLQGLLASVFAVNGIMKLARSKQQLAQSMGWVEDFSPGTIRAIGVAEVLAAVGLLLPGLTGAAPVLTPLAAIGLVALMVGAAGTHARRREWPMIVMNVVLALMAMVVAWGRFGQWPL